MHIDKDIYYSPDLTGAKRLAKLQRLRSHRLRPYDCVLLDSPLTDNQLEIYSGLEWNRGDLDDRRVLGLASNFIRARFLVLRMVKDSLALGYEGRVRRLFEEDEP